MAQKKMKKAGMHLTEEEKRREESLKAAREGREYEPEKQEPQKKDMLRRTNLSWDEYWWAIEEAFIMLGSTYRAADKPMAAMKAKFEAHLTNRLLHEINVANKMKEIARRTQLNEKLAYNGMFGHDNGHPYSAHDGEEIYDEIGEIYGLCYFHHNEKSAEVLEADELLKTALILVKNDMEKHEKTMNMNEQQKQDYQKYKEYKLNKLAEDFYYIIDITISHDGEASPQSLTQGPDKRYQDYSSIKDIVRDKERRSKTVKGDYKFIAQTPEGMLGKYADVFAYLTTDIMDGYRLGIFKLLNDDYLEIYGKILSDDMNKTKEEYIKLAKNRIAEYTRLYTTHDAQGVNNESPEMQKAIENAMKKINDEGLDIRLITEKKFFEQQKKEMKPKNEEEKKQIEEYFKNIEINGEKVLDRIKEIASEAILSLGDTERFKQMSPGEQSAIISRTANNIWTQIFSNSKTIAAVTTEVSEFFMNDLVENSKGKSIPTLSPKAAAIYADAKHWGYKYYVPEVKTVYQKKRLPENTLKIVEYFTDKLLETGAIEKKLLDPRIREKIPEEKLKCIADKMDDLKSEEDDKRNTPSKVFSIVNNVFNTEKPTKETEKILRRMKDVIHKQDERFALTYSYLYDAIESRVRNKVETVLKGGYAQDMLKKNDGELTELDLRLIKELDEIKAIINYNNPDLIKNYNDNTKEKYEAEKEKIIQTLITNDRKKMIEKMAYQFVCDYISGKTDTDIKNLAIELKCMNNEQYNEDQKRVRHDTDTLKNLKESSIYKAQESENGERED